MCVALVAIGATAWAQRPDAPAAPGAPPAPTPPPATPPPPPPAATTTPPVARPTADAPACTITDDRPIVGFRVRGKTKLRAHTLTHLVHRAEGDPVSCNDIPALVAALISSELFEQVDVALVETPGGVEVVATLDDKLSWFAAPTLYLLPNRWSVGGGFVENNLTGRNQKLLLYGQLGSRESLLFGTYLDPRVGGSDWTYRFDVYLYRRTNDEYANPADDATDDTILRTSIANYIGGGLLVGYNLRWWLVADMRFRGAYVFYDEPQAPDGTPLPAPQSDGRDATIQTRLTLDRRQYHFGVRWGPYLQLFTEVAIPGLDSYGYQSALLRAYYSWRLFREHQLELRTNLSVARHLPFHNDTVLGGTIDLRGYTVDRFRGDTRAMFRVEYSVPIVKVNMFAFRAIGFWDSGFMGMYFPRPDVDAGGDRDFLPGLGDGANWLRNDVGAGIRIYVKSVVLPLLGLDVAYGLEGKSTEVYFQLGIVDF